jgi:hypothetical protein
MLTRSKKSLDHVKKRTPIPRRSSLYPIHSQARFIVYESVRLAALNLLIHTSKSVHCHHIAVDTINDKRDQEDAAIHVRERHSFCRRYCNITSNNFYKCTATFRKQICKKFLRIKLNGGRPVQTLVDITSSTFYKCTATFRTQICRKCLRIKLNDLSPV